MKDVNKVMLIGRLGADPTHRATKSGLSVVNFPLATSRKVRGEQPMQPIEHGEVSQVEVQAKGRTEVEETQWHRVVAWGKQGEACAQFLRKGQVVYVEGMIRSRKFEAKDGTPRMAFEVHADTVSFLGKPIRGSMNEVRALGEMDKIEAQGAVLMN